VISAWWLVVRKNEVASSQSPAVSKRGSLRPGWCCVVPAAFAAIAVTTPFLLHSAPMIGFSLQRAFALVCHQQMERSFFLFGGSVAVCARCLGIYFGAAVGLLVHIERRFAMHLLRAAVAVNAADWLAELAGLHGNWMVARFALGIALGAAAAMMVTASSQRLAQPNAA